MQDYIHLINAPGGNPLAPAESNHRPADGGTTWSVDGGTAGKSTEQILLY